MSIGYICLGFLTGADPSPSGLPMHARYPYQPCAGRLTTPRRRLDAYGSHINHVRAVSRRPAGA
jgi:hypothetical protein